MSNIIVDIMADNAEKAAEVAQAIPGFTVIRSYKDDGRDGVWCFVGTAEQPIESGEGVLSIDIDYDEEVTPQDYVFVAITEDESQYFGIVRRSYWKARLCLHDNDRGIKLVLPDRFGGVMESTYEYYGGDFEQGKQCLLQAGLTEATEKSPCFD